MGEMVFRQVDVSTAEVDAVQARFAPLTEAVRELVAATILSNADDGVVAEALAAVRDVTAKLSASVETDHAGVNYNGDGRSWNWGNAGSGERNAIAPPIELMTNPDGSTYADLVLGAPYEGPPGHVHGGVSALLLDHLMGVTASQMSRPTFTGTLTLRYRNPLPLGPVRVEGRVAREEGRKVFVEASITGASGIALEADGVFITPTWSPSLASGLPGLEAAQD
ncbi:MAG: PaaI family thioesterase [Marmoricola sp.]